MNKFSFKKLVSALVITAATVSISACNFTATNEQQPAAKSFTQTQTQFQQFSEKFIEDFWRQNPGYGVYVGYYKFDDQLPVPDAKGMAQELNFYKDKLEQIQQIDVNQLPANLASDYYILKNEIESAIWYATELKSHQWNPANYNVAGVFGVILNTDYKPKTERLQTIIQRMANIPAYYQAAQVNLTDPTVTHTKLAIQQNQGAVALFEQRIANAVAESDLAAADKNLFEQRLNETTTAIQGYISWLEKKLPELEKSAKTRDFRIGKALYDTKFKYDIYSGFSAKELYDTAMAEKQRVHQEMITIANKLWPKYFKNQAKPSDPLVMIKTLIDHISVKHVKRDEFVDSIRQQIPELEAFVMANNLIEMDKDKPLVVRETPEYQRGFAGASINAPGPYDAGANTYYNVTPLDGMSDEQAESYLREYNHWLLQILNIHEAVPGHYTQLVHSNKSKSLVKSIFGNGAMIEGWAVYTERMMLEEGYGDFEPELWLMYYKWNLRVIMNSILDYSIQVKGINEQQALDLMINQAFQEKAEAQGKWRRATLSQVQLTSYFTGYSEIYQLREDLKQATGDGFNLTNFHNQFLSYGSAPVPIIRELMFDDYVAKHTK
ncbi:MAG: DUF885 domain-containing protein [Gammaproteobacteria bacterium]|nr:DUF885 domain-containing protein [Gammaproteobacteria bacterium]